jgi:hypothetical protein
MHRDYKIYLHPKYTTIGINDTLTYNIVFNGKSDYVITLCTNQKFYPINIKLLQPVTGKELFDNAKDGYIESLGIGFDNTQNIILKVVLLAKKMAKARYLKMKKHASVCHCNVKLIQKTMNDM